LDTVRVVLLTGLIIKADLYLLPLRLNRAGLSLQNNITISSMEFVMKKFLIIPFVLIGFCALNSFYPQPARAISSTVVISEFRTRGPAGANDEFIELFNLSLSPVDISGWEIRGSNSEGTVTTRAIIANGVSLNPFCHFLLTNSNTNGYSGRVPGNQTYGVGITDDGGIALVNSSGTIIDQVGMSSGAAFKEGSTLAPLITSINRSYERRPGGAPGNTQDTDNNENDFRPLSPSQPQNALADCFGTGIQINPSGSGVASPSTVLPGANTLLIVTVTPGMNPQSTGLGVSVNLSSIGGSTFQQFFDNGTNGDVTAGDSVFTFRATIPATTLAGARGLPVTITDAQGRQAGATIDLFIEGATSNCGTGRLSVKTGTDPDASMVNLLNIVPTTLSMMRSWTAPNPIPVNVRISPFEKTVYVVNATLTMYKLDVDSDYHLVLEDARGRTIIAKVVCACCVGAQSPFLNSIIEVRNLFDARLTATTSFQNVSIPVRITGVGFFEFIQGQTGVAPNGIELHPILDIAFDVNLQKPYIVNASVTGKKLFVQGLNFAEGAVILINGEEQKTRVDEENPSVVLIGKKAGKNIAPGQTVTLQIRLADGTLSKGFSFTKQ
jgi:hypothetical protein